MSIFLTGIGAAAQQERVLHSFPNPSTGLNGPAAGMILDGSGDLYGTAWGGGIYFYGSVFEMVPKAAGGWTEKTLHSFYFDGTDGIFPYAALTIDAAGNLYGTTKLGGIGGGGIVFQLIPDTNGGWTENILHNFSANGVDGYQPLAGLVFDAVGNLYGTTTEGGANHMGGTVFELTPQPGGGWTEKVIYSFCSQSNCSDGYSPHSGVILDSTGNLYGATYLGGMLADGTVFRLMPQVDGSWTENVLHSGHGVDGYRPRSPLVFDPAGNLYGTTDFGGSDYRGAVFELSPASEGNWTEKILYNFNAAMDGDDPSSGLVFDDADNLYGTTVTGGLQGIGTVFELMPTDDGHWSEKILHSFVPGSWDGAYPYAGMVFDGAGKLYGTTEGGGSNGGGSVFEITQ